MLMKIPMTGTRAVYLSRASTCMTWKAGACSSARFGEAQSTRTTRHGRLVTHGPSETSKKVREYCIKALSYISWGHSELVSFRVASLRRISLETIITFFPPKHPSRITIICHALQQFSFDTPLRSYFMNFALHIWTTQCPDF